MKTQVEQRVRELERRLRRLERQLSRLTPEYLPPAGLGLLVPPAVPFALGLGVLVCGYLGVGLPQHYYQPLFAALLLAFAYHRGIWELPSDPWRWPQLLLNFLILCLFFKLLIGAGKLQPLGWLKLPALKHAPPSQGAPWYDQILPRFDFEWQGVPTLTELSIDLTMAQSLLLIATLAGALFRFQPFASLTAVLLLLVSIPALASFNWEWVVLFLVFGGIALYLQTPPFTSAGRLPRA